MILHEKLENGNLATLIQFGGDVLVGSRVRTDKTCGVLTLSDLKEKVEIGKELPEYKDAKLEDLPNIITLIFNKVESIEVVINHLNILKEQMNLLERNKKRRRMKAITVKQPWASLIAHGIKNIENRTWACPKKYIGQRVLIHASARPDDEPYAIFNDEQAFVIDDTIMDVFGYYHQTSSIIGSVQIVDCVQNHPSAWAEKSMENKCPNCKRIIKRHFNEDYFFCEHCGRKCTRRLHYEKPIYNWVLANPILFEKPIPAKGKLSFWDFDGVIEEGGKP